MASMVGQEAGVTPVKKTKSSLLGFGRKSSARKGTTMWDPESPSVALSEASFGDTGSAWKGPPSSGKKKPTKSLEGIAVGRVAQEKLKRETMVLSARNGEFGRSPAKRGPASRLKGAASLPATPEGRQAAQLATPQRNGSVAVDSRGAYFFDAVTGPSPSLSTKSKGRESLEGLRGTGRVSQLREAHLAAWAKENERKFQRDFDGKDVRSLVSLFEDALRRHEEAKAAKLGSSGRYLRSSRKTKLGVVLEPDLALENGATRDDDDDNGNLLGAVRTLGGAHHHRTSARFANVSSEAKTLVVQIEAASALHHLEYYHMRQGAAIEGEWVRVPDSAVRLEIDELGIHFFAGRSVDPETGEVLTLPTTAVFENSAGLPEIVKSVTHSAELRRTLDACQATACAACGLDLTGQPAYVCCRAVDDHADAIVCDGSPDHVLCGYALCVDCAIPSKKPDPTKARHGSTSKKRRSSVALDVGAKRLWLSEDVQFAGNKTSILADSQELVDQIASLLVAHPSNKIELQGPSEPETNPFSPEAVLLESHTNSTCNLSCDGSNGPCSNGTCHANFGHTGGAVAFSLRRAEAVKEALVSKGVEPWRIKVAGLAGSRRLVDDTEGPSKEFNRRVEIHLADDVDDDDNFESPSYEAQPESPSNEEEEEEETLEAPAAPAPSNRDSTSRFIDLEDL